jgi:tetratricopeptide (TPR) repeat protein
MSLKRIKKDIGGNFVGRQKIVKQVYKNLDRGEAGTVFTGAHGIGKSTLLARMGAMLQAKGFDVIAFAGETTAELILNSVAARAKERGVEEAERVFLAPMEFVQKLSWLAENFLLKERILLLFDDFEANQDEEGKILNANLREMMDFLKDSLKNHSSAVLIAGLQAVPEFASTPVEPFTFEELYEFLVNTGALNRLDKGALQSLLDEYGGSPLVVELLDKIALREFGERDFTLDELKKTVPPARNRQLEHALLTKLFEYVDESRLNLLKIISIYDFPVSRDVLKAHGVEVDPLDLEELVKISLLEYDSIRAVYHVHTLVNRFVLERMEAEEKRDQHRQAAELLTGTLKGEQKISLDYEMESLRHYRLAAEWERVVEKSIQLERELSGSGYPQMAFDVLTAIIDKDMGDQSRATVHQRLGFLNALFGSYEAAVEESEKALEIHRDLGDEEQAAADLQQLGSIYLREKLYDRALKYFGESLAVAQKIGNDKISAVNLQQMGDIHAEKEEPDEAVRHYKQALEIYGRLREIMGATRCTSQLARIYFEQEDYTTSLRYHLSTYVAYTRLGLPQARSVRKDIMEIREQMGVESFNGVLQPFGIPPDTFDPAKEEQHKSMDFLQRATLEATAAKTMPKEQRQDALIYLGQILDSAPKEGNPQVEGVKAYFQMLLAYVKDEDIEPYKPQVPAPLLTLFEKMKK